MGDLLNRLKTMSKIIPFPAFLPDKKLVQKIVCPPYDVITTSEARTLVEGNPYSLLHITRAEVDLPPSVYEYDSSVYERAKINFENFKKEKYLFQDEPSLYVYRIISGDHVQTGVVCGASVDEYDSGLIKKHEKTRKEKEDDRTRFADTINAHAEPVLFMAKMDDLTKTLMDQETRNVRPLYEVFDRDGARHILWRVQIKANLVTMLADVVALYIADGHHRSAVASRVRQLKKNNNFFPVVIFPHDELCVYRYDWDGDPAKRPLADVTTSDIMAVADRNEIMPPKSTWFAPKLLSGLFLYALV